MMTFSEFRRNSIPAKATAVVTLAVALSIAGSLTAGDAAPVVANEAAQRGYALLTGKPYQPAEFTAEQFDTLWKVWPPGLRAAAEQATPSERRRMTLSRYGLTPKPESPDGAPLAVVETDRGWSMSCLACHSGKVAGRVLPGVGNSHYAFQTLIQDVTKSQRAAGRPMGRGQASAAFIPLGQSNGTTNAQTASVILSSLRDHDLNLLDRPRDVEFQHSDLDAPPFWNTKKKSHLYIDGFVPKTARVIMQFLLVPVNSGETIRGWEGDFQDVLAWIESVEPPPYPFPIDRALAEQGTPIFNQSCAGCHGTYGPGGSYPEKRVDIEEIGTDRVRLDGMPVEHRRFYGESWFGEYGQLKVIDRPTGYVAPPLDGIWASAPYLHNGSVPTLWHLMHAEQRPVVWLRSEDGYDQDKVGLEVTTFDDLPSDVRRADEKRRYFHTRLRGKSAVGHTFPETLSEVEKRAVLEYLKTL